LEFLFRKYTIWHPSRRRLFSSEFFVRETTFKPGSRSCFCARKIGQKTQLQNRTKNAAAKSSLGRREKQEDDAKKQFGSSVTRWLRETNRPEK
jgi:hypothetical protein